MLIRVEIPVDAMGIDRLLRQSFETSAEAELVQRLREDGLLTLGVVATDDEGHVIGYVGFTPVDINGEDHQWVGLAPLAVAEQYRRQGLGEKLVYEGLDSLNEFGYGAVVVLGDHAYYRRFGFKLANEYQLYCQWPDCEDYFQLYPLTDVSLEDCHGLVTYSAHFENM
ncbi:GNAT family N-acetyltransferase [Xenorhabdus hominickii]|uniref:Acetyltransferase n=1 Tax=Xenorhabdus hominickii TaxID=351679 RepID=A0A2G0QE61_XENHO|nr:N-acetyltransferase [Xenorhabdus hominickii]AOM41506.1 acetyltransferase [Xenorhabdus hominickii]PHM57449.1 GNAT family N-acetyltransferase [Xenorhabdus hominickii]